MATPPSSGKKRALPDDIDLGTPKRTRDYHNGIRNHVVAKKHSRYGYTLTIKAEAKTDEEGQQMAQTILNDLFVQGDAGYWGKKTAEESYDGKPKEAQLYFQFYTPKGMTDIKAAATKHLGEGVKLADTTGDWTVNPTKVRLSACSEGLQLTSGGNFSYLHDKLQMIAGHVEGMTATVDSSSNCVTFSIPDMDQDIAVWLKDKICKVMRMAGVELMDMTTRSCAH